jgi:hypothetical protein
MKNLIRIVSILLILLPTKLFAQATSTSKIVVDQPAPTLVIAQGYTYKYYEGTTGTILTGTTCTGTTSPFPCTFTFPAFTPGSHTITVTASDTSVTPNLESPKSAPLTFTFVVVPQTPLNPRIQ